MALGSTSLSRLSVAVVMAPVLGLIANRSRPSSSVYLISTCFVAGWSLSVAFNFPTNVPAAVSLVRIQNRATARSCPCAFPTCFALLQHRHLQRACEGGGVVVHVVYDDDEGQRLVQLLVGDLLENSDSQLEEEAPRCTVRRCRTT